MATPSQVKAAMVAIAGRIANATRMRQEGKELIKNAHAELMAIPQDYRDVIETVAGYSPTGSPFERLTRDEKEKLEAEFIALRDAIDLELQALGLR